MRTRSPSAAFFRFVFLIVDVISDAKDGHLLNPLWFMNSQMRPIHAQLHAQDGAMAAMKAARMEMMISDLCIVDVFVDGVRYIKLHSLRIGRSPAFRNESLNSVPFFCTGRGSVPAARFVVAPPIFLLSR